MEVNISDLLMIIGRQTVEIEFLKNEIEKLNSQSSTDVLQSPQNQPVNNHKEAEKVK